jgi:hypothetical protein
MCAFKPSFALSAHGLERAASVSEEPFTFITNDKTINSLILESGNSGIDWKRIFSLVELLMTGVAIVPNRSDLSGLFELAAFLGNTELLDLFPNEAPIELNNVCARMRNRQAFGRSMDAEIAFAASHFYELDIEDLRELDDYTIERIVSSPSLRLKDENSFLQLIRELDFDGTILLRHVRTEYLTNENVSLFPRDDSL